MKLRRVPAPALGPDTVAVVAEAFLPMVHWRGIPVLRQERQELTVLERFVLEMGLTLGSVEAADFTEVTSLPASMLAGATWRLVASGALVPQKNDDGRYRLNREQAETALSQQAVNRIVRSSADFVLLPRSGDLVAVPSSDGGWLRTLEQNVAADRQAPVPRPLWSVNRAAYLRERVRAGTVAGLDDGVVDVPVPDEGDRLLIPPAKGQKSSAPPVCPTYRCRAEVRRRDEGTFTVNAVIIGNARRSKKNGAATTEVEIELDGVRKLVEGWLKLADALEDPQLLRTAWRELGPPSTGHGRPPLTTAQRRGPAEWDLHVSGAAAQEICAEGRPLTKPMGLAVQGEEAVVELVCRFFPCDNEARALFLRDEAIAQLLASERPARQYADVLRQAAAAIPAHGSFFATKAVLDRIWRLGYYQLVYDLRERMDFAYD